jgi:Domain of unknown function (DUF1707)
MPGYSEYGGQPWHHAAWSGPGSSLEAFLLILASLLLLVLVTAAVAGFVRLCAQGRRDPSHVGHSGTAGDNGQAPAVLASEAERDEVLQTISHAVGEGRLDLDEAERRIEAALHSRHRHELVELVGDLPRHVPSKPGSRWGSPRLGRGLLALAAVTILAAVVVQAVAGLWELWPVAVTGCGLWTARPRR